MVNSPSFLVCDVAVSIRRLKKPATCFGETSISSAMYRMTCVLVILVVGSFVARAALTGAAVAPTAFLVAVFFNAVFFVANGPPLD